MKSVLKLVRFNPFSYASVNSRDAPSNQDRDQVSGFYLIDNSIGDLILWNQFERHINRQARTEQNNLTKSNHPW